MPAALVATMLASAPTPASMPLQTSLLTTSLSIGARPYLSRLETVADRRRYKGLCLLEVGVGGGGQLEDPAGELLLDRAVEGHRGERGVDVAAEGARLLPVGDDLGDRVVGAADLRQVGAAEGVRRAGDLDDDHLHQFRVVAIGVDDEAGHGLELGARRGLAAVGLVDRRQQQRPALAEQLVEDLVLRLEVVVDEAVGDARLVYHYFKSKDEVLN